MHKGLEIGLFLQIEYEKNNTIVIIIRLDI
jgi:hypothetical protein